MLMLMRKCEQHKTNKWVRSSAYAYAYAYAYVAGVLTCLCICYAYACAYAYALVRTGLLQKIARIELHLTLKWVLSSCTGSQEPQQRTKPYTTASQLLLNKERTMAILL